MITRKLSGDKPSPTQTFFSPLRWYSIQYPRTWEMEVVEGVPSFYDPLFGSGGVLQLLSVKTGADSENEIVLNSPFLAGENISQKMVLFLEKQNISHDIKSFQGFRKDTTNFLVHEYRTAGRFYMALMAERETTFVLALYNCPGEPEEQEAKVISEILKSLTLL